MNRHETKFLVINTPLLWENMGEGEKTQVTDQGITLSKSDAYSYMDTFIPGDVEPKSLDLDLCGLLYILDESGEGIFVFDPTTRRSWCMDCISLENPQSIAVNETDIHVVEGDRIICLARINGQIRWEKELTAEKAGNIKIASYGRDGLYVLDIDEKKVFRTGREWRLDDTTEIISNFLGSGDEMNSEKEQDYFDIASDRENNIYILINQEERREILKFNPKGELEQSIEIPFEEDVDFLNLAVESGGAIFLVFESKVITGKESAETRGIVRLSKSFMYERSGTYKSDALDSTISGCCWHKVILDADIPENTQVRLYYFASDGKESPSDRDFETNPVLVNPKDTLITGARGRYIFFKIELLSDEMCLSSPLVRSLKVHFPRVSYLRYLPETFQENESSREFLERFLSIFETFMSRSEEEIYHFAEYLDPSAAPSPFIPWLSSWLAIAYEENWPLDKKRLLIKHAPAIYKKRGTRAALSRMIQVFYGQAPIIFEHFQFACMEDAWLRDYLEQKLYGSDPYGFSVLLKPAWEKPDSPVKKARSVTSIELTTMQRIIDAEKPAHTHGVLHLLQPWFNLDMHTYLEVNTVLNKSEFVLGVTSVLGRDTIINGVEQAGQVERKSRIGIDLTLT